jgi:RNA polymerase sigma-70 factor (ECF subfamily)
MTRHGEWLDLFLADKPRLVQLAAGITGCQCLAEDIVQDSMLKVCEAGLGDTVRAPRSYLFRMVRNLAIDCVRRQAREARLIEGDDQTDEIAAAFLCPETGMACRKALRIIQAALDELPERTRQAFTLHRIEGVPQRDIASQMAVSPTLINFMVRDAHNHCRQRLIGEHIDAELVPATAGRAAGVAY